MAKNSKGFIQLVIVLVLFLIAAVAITYSVIKNSNNTTFYTSTNNSLQESKDTDIFVQKKVRATSLPNGPIEEVVATDDYLYIRFYDSLYFTRVVGGVVEDNFEEVGHLPMSDGSHLITDIIYSNNYFYLFGLKDLTPEGKVFPVLKPNADIYKGEPSPDGNIVAWNKLSVSSPSVPLVNGSHIVKSYDNYFYMIMSIDANDSPIFKAAIKKNGDLTEWESLESLPKPIFGCCPGPNPYLFSDGSFYLIKKEDLLLEYDINLNGNLDMFKGKVLILPEGRSGLVPRNYSFFIKDKKLFYLGRGGSASEEVLQLEFASLEEQRVNFKPLVEINTDLENSRISYANNTDNLFIIITRLDDRNKVKYREIVTLQLTR